MYDEKRLKLFDINVIAITLIMVAEICFFKVDSIRIYWMLSAGGMLLSFANNFKYFTTIIRKNSLLLWLIPIYIIYFIYGFLFLQKGQFNWDTLLYRMVESIALYYASTGILKKRKIDNLILPFIVAGIISAIYLLTLESSLILLGGVRIGDSLSGNVNTVGYNFGLISVLLMWWYCQKHSRIKLILLILFSALMLVTGSKKVLIVLVVDIAVLFFYERKRLSGWLKLLVVLAIGLYVLFNVPYFYEIIGIRIEGMIMTMFGNASSSMYSYSTDVRNEMIAEAFKVFSNKPIFGGGWNNFYASTNFGYEYSHCNYTELLCSFGIIGTVFYYSRHVYNIKVALKRLKNQECINSTILALALVVVVLFLDWAVVTFSSQCVWYLPIILSSAILNEISNE